MAGCKWWQALSVHEFPKPRLPELGFLWGTSSLWHPPNAAVNPTPTPARRPKRVIDDEAIRKLQEVRRKAITQKRACAFVERTLKSPGDRIQSDQLVIRDHDALVDILSCLCYANAARTNFRVQRTDYSTGMSRYVLVGDWYLERFILERTH
jgi:hypothetical protein